MNMRADMMINWIRGVIAAGTGTLCCIPGTALGAGSAPLSIALSFQKYGSGSPIICLHGFGASTYSWRELVPALSKNHEVYLLDLKGFGRSPKPRDGHYSIYDQSKLVLQFIAEHGLTDLTIVGHSFGGGVTLATALELEHSRPGTLRALVLIDAAAYEQSFPGFIRVLRLPLLGPLAQRIVPIGAQVRMVLRKAYFNDGLIPDASVREYAAALHEPGGKDAVRETARQLVPADVDSFSARYSSIRVPTLIIWGGHDEIVPLSVGERLHAAIAGSKFVLVPDAGHIPHEETPDVVRPVVEAFTR
jgi:pimeloyl-ACP methyl ester carboxylesterase